MLDEVWSVKVMVCLFCCPWIVFHPSTDCVSGLLIPIRQGLSPFPLAWRSHPSDRSLSVLTLLARWPWLPKIYSCEVLIVLLLFFVGFTCTKNGIVAKKPLHVSHFIIWLNHTFNSCTRAPMHTDARQSIGCCVAQYEWSRKLHT